MKGEIIVVEEDQKVHRQQLEVEEEFHILKGIYQMMNLMNIVMMKLEKARAWFNVKAAKLPQPASSVIYTDEDVISSAARRQLRHMLEPTLDACCIGRDDSWGARSGPLAAMGVKSRFSVQKFYLYSSAGRCETWIRNVLWTRDRQHTTWSPSEVT